MESIRIIDFSHSDGKNVILSDFLDTMKGLLKALAKVVILSDNELIGFSLIYSGMEKLPSNFGREGR